MVVLGKFGNLLDFGGGSRESLEDLSDVRTGLHGDDSQLIFFVDPDEESLVVVVEDSSAFGPFSFQAGRLKVLVTLLEQEVVVNQRLLVLGTHRCKGVIFSLEITFEVS